MIINLIGQVIVHHPLADDDCISVLTLDSRKTLLEVFDGRVYHEHGSTKHGMVDFETQHEKYIRTAIPIGINGTFRCCHRTDQDRKRRASIKINDEIIVVEALDEDKTNERVSFAIDLKLKANLVERSEATLWSYVLDDY